MPIPSGLWSQQTPFVGPLNVVSRPPKNLRNSLPPFSIQIFRNNLY